MRFLVALILLVGGLASFFVNFNIVFDYLILCHPFDPTLSISEIILYVVGILVAILISWLLASFDENMMTINLCGTRLYGRTVVPQGFIATKWLVIAGLPIIPIRSYDVLAEQYAGMGKSYAMNPRENLEWGQIIRTAFIGYGILIVIELASMVFVNWVICFR